MDQVKSFFAPNKIILWIVLVLVFGLGLAIRLYDLTDIPLDFHPTRQLHSAIMARGMYYQHLDDVSEWKRDMAVRQWKAEGLIEPPFIEWLTAQAYKLIGNDTLWVARLYSIFFWMLGSIAMFLLAKELTGIDGAVIALIYFLILPYGAIASRAFQPDPLLTALIVFALWAMVTWYRKPTWHWVITAGLIGGIAILSKATAVFFVGSAWVGLIVIGKGLRKAVRDPQVWTLAFLTVLPYALFHYYGMYISGLLQSQFSLRFFPQLWSDPVFYLRWNGEISSVVGFEWFLLAFLGTFLIRERAHRAMLIAVWFGYFAYGMTLPYHISTHDYYQLPLIPVVAIGLAAGSEALFRNLKGSKWLLYPAVIGVVLFGMVIKAWDVRVTLKRMDYHNEVAFWEKLGGKLNPGSAVVGLTHDYGYRLAYWGWVQSDNWMTSGDFNYRQLAGYEYDMETLFEELTAGREFFVVTLFGELEHQPALKSMLYSNYPIYEQTDEYLIFDLRPDSQP